MNKDSIEDDALRTLIDDIYYKIEKSEQNDSKILQEKSSTLNWILTYSILLLGIINNIKSPICRLFHSINIILLGISVVILLIYKLKSTKYELNKVQLLETFLTHKIEMKADLKYKLKVKLTEKPIFGPKLYESIRNGIYIEDLDTKKSINCLDCKIKHQSEQLKLLFNIALGIFIINVMYTFFELIINYGG